MDMEIEKRIAKGVHVHYWDHDDNCAVTTLTIVARLFRFEPDEQVLKAALGLWGAGGHRAQCGLVEGALFSIGLLGSRRGLDRTQVSRLCRRFAESFEACFGSLICRELRPEGFSPDNPPHLCEDLSVRAISFTTRFLADAFQAEPRP
jgi:hypothetical protein